MRELSFSGFLSRYVVYLSAGDSRSLRRLCAEAAENNARLREPLLLYAAFTGKLDYFGTQAKKAGLDGYYGLLLSSSGEKLKNALQNGTLPPEYQKVWNSYLVEKHQKDRENETVELMRQKILRLQKQNGVSSYRIYTDLRLNPGNINAWLKHGSGDKVSLDTARRVLDYVKTK